MSAAAETEDVIVHFQSASHGAVQVRSHPVAHMKFRTSKSFKGSDTDADVRKYILQQLGVLWSSHVHVGCAGAKSQKASTDPPKRLSSLVEGQPSVPPQLTFELRPDSFTISVRQNVASTQPETTEVLVEYGAVHTDIVDAAAALIGLPPPTFDLQHMALVHSLAGPPTHSDITRHPGYVYCGPTSSSSTVPDAFHVEFSSRK
jgi:hypothetical protein